MTTKTIEGEEFFQLTELPIYYLSKSGRLWRDDVSNFVTESGGAYSIKIGRRYTRKSMTWLKSIVFGNKKVFSGDSRAKSSHYQIRYATNKVWHLMTVNDTVRKSHEDIKHLRGKSIDQVRDFCTENGYLLKDKNTKKIPRRVLAGDVIISPRLGGEIKSDISDIARILKRFRKAASLTQKDADAGADLPDNFTHDLENGNLPDMKISQLQRLCYLYRAKITIKASKSDEIKAESEKNFHKVSQVKSPVKVTEKIVNKQVIKKQNIIVTVK